MEGPVARWYEKNSRGDLNEFRRLAARLRSFLPDGGDVLEVAPGPGFLPIELARDGRLRVTGLDISKTFVRLAGKNAAQAGVRVDFRAGNASAMPFADNSFDLLACRAAFKNFSEPEKALREMRRVLRPGGTSVIIDLRRDTPMTAIHRYIDRSGLNAWNRWVTALTFRFMLLKRATQNRNWRRCWRASVLRRPRCGPTKWAWRHASRSNGATSGCSRVARCVRHTLCELLPTSHVRRRHRSTGYKS